MSSKKAAPKRKQAEPSSAPEALQPSSDDEAPAPKVANRGLAMFEASVAETAPPAKHSGGSGNTCSVEGVVLRAGTLCPAARERYFVVRVAALQKLNELEPVEEKR